MTNMPGPKEADEGGKKPRQPKDASHGLLKHVRNLALPVSIAVASALGLGTAGCDNCQLPQVAATEKVDDDVEKNFILNAQHRELGLTPHALRRTVSPLFWATTDKEHDEFLRLHLIGPHTMGSESTKERDVFNYTFNPTFSSADKLSELKTTWADVALYCRSDMSDSDFALLIVKNFEKLTGKKIDAKKIKIVRDKNKKITDVEYHGENGEYSIPVWEKGQGKWVKVPTKKSFYHDKQHHLEMPVVADGELILPREILKNDAELTLTITIHGKKETLKISHDALVKSFRDTLDFRIKSEKDSELKFAISAFTKELSNFIVKGAKTREEKIKMIYDFVQNSIGYSNDSDGSASPEAVVLNGVGQCNEKTILAFALLAAQGIDSYDLRIDVELPTKPVSRSGHAALGVTGNFPGVKPFAKDSSGQPIYYAEVAGGFTPIGKLTFKDTKPTKNIHILPP